MIKKRCGPCKNVSPYYEEFKNKYSEHVHFEKIDVDQNAELSAKHEVQAMPTFCFMKPLTTAHRDEHKENDGLKRVVGGDHRKLEENIVQLMKCYPCQPAQGYSL